MTLKPLAIAIILGSAGASAAQDVGFAELSIAAPHHQETMETVILFPAHGPEETRFAGNAVFEGVDLLENAEPAAGQYPLVLLSHGWGGNYDRMAWLGAGLAERGAVVLAVNHPGSTTRDFDSATAMNHWTRAQDLSAALDHLLADPGLAPLIDESRIYAAGFSYGGWTALSLAGVRGSRDGFFDYCAAAGARSQFCAELAARGVDISGIDQRLYEATYRDPRIAAVAAIDPGLTWGLTPQDVADVRVPVLLVGLGEGTHRLQATDTSASGFTALLPEAANTRIAPAMHFSALGLCTPAGAAILADEGDDPVCTDPEGTDRRAVLQQIVTAMAGHFGLE